MKFKIVFAIGIIINLMIWINSLLPGSISSAQSSVFVRQLVFIFSPLNRDFNYATAHLIVRKVAHFTQFFILAFIWFWIYKTFHPYKKVFVIVILHGLITAIIDESIQRFVPGRSGNITDVAIDFSGVVTGILIASLIYYKNKKHRGYSWNG